jgi:hypothetical protein
MDLYGHVIPAAAFSPDAKQQVLGCLHLLVFFSLLKLTQKKVYTTDSHQAPCPCQVFQARR